MKKNINKRLLVLLFGCTLASSCINSLMLGFTPYAIFPFSHYLIVGFIWSYRAFDSYMSLFLSFLMIGILIFGLIRIIVWNKTFWPVFLLYLLDLILVFHLSTSSYGYGYEISFILSGIADAAVVLLILYRAGHSFRNRTGDGSKPLKKCRTGNGSLS